MSNSGRLARTLGLWELVFIGIILVQPTAPMPPYGVINAEAHGHVVTTILIAMIAMLFTALSYGRMAAAYPSAGSAYTYVGRELHPGLGFATGWSMIMDYLLNPIICCIWSSKAAINIVPAVPYGLWALFFAALFTFMNLRRIRATARINMTLTFIMGAVVAAMLVCVVRYLLRMPVLDAAVFLRPFYDPATFSWGAIATGTSVAVLTYIGFDGISTLSEEVHNPRRNILLATVLICLITGILSAVEVYAAQLVWPSTEPFPDMDTAYVHVAGRVGGAWLFQIVNVTLLVATIGSGAGAQLSGARLLYGMGRDDALPRSFFGAIDERSGIPARNVILIGVLSLAGAFLLNYQLGAELLNFGAFIGFMGVNAAAFVHYYLRSENRRWHHAVAPLLGFGICLAIWLSLRPPAKIAGFVWMAIGLTYGWFATGGFRRELRFEAPPE